MPLVRSEEAAIAKKAITDDKMLYAGTGENIEAKMHDIRADDRRSQFKLVLVGGRPIK